MIDVRRSTWSVMRIRRLIFRELPGIINIPLLMILFGCQTTIGYEYIKIPKEAETTLPERAKEL